MEIKNFKDITSLFKNKTNEEIVKELETNMNSISLLLTKGQVNSVEDVKGASALFPYVNDKKSQEAIINVLKVWGSTKSLNSEDLEGLSTEALVALVEFIDTNSESSSDETAVKIKTELSEDYYPIEPRTDSKNLESSAGDAIDPKHLAIAKFLNHKPSFFREIKDKLVSWGLIPRLYEKALESLERNILERRDIIFNAANIYIWAAMRYTTNDECFKVLPYRGKDAIVAGLIQHGKVVSLKNHVVSPFGEELEVTEVNSLDLAIEEAKKREKKAEEKKSVAKSPEEKKPLIVEVKVEAKPSASELKKEVLKQKEAPKKEEPKKIREKAFEQGLYKDLKQHEKNLIDLNEIYKNKTKALRMITSAKGKEETELKEKLSKIIDDENKIKEFYAELVPKIDDSIADKLKEKKYVFDKDTPLPMKKKFMKDFTVEYDWTEEDEQNKKKKAEESKTKTKEEGTKEKEPKKKKVNVAKLDNENKKLVIAVKAANFKVGMRTTGKYIPVLPQLVTVLANSKSLTPEEETKLEERIKDPLTREYILESIACRKQPFVHEGVKMMMPSDFVRCFGAMKSMQRKMNKVGLSEKEKKSIERAFRSNTREISTIEEKTKIAHNLLEEFFKSQDYGSMMRFMISKDYKICSKNNSAYWCFRTNASKFEEINEMLDAIENVCDNSGKNKFKDLRKLPKFPEFFSFTQTADFITNSDQTQTLDFIKSKDYVKLIRRTTSVVNMVKRSDEAKPGKKDETDKKKKKIKKMAVFDRMSAYFTVLRNATGYVTSVNSVSLRDVFISNETQSQEDALVIKSR